MDNCSSFLQQSRNLLIVLGAYLILKPWFDKQGLFGKAEHS